MEVLIMTLILALTVTTPFVVIYGLKFAKLGDYPKHRKIQNIVFIVCIIGLIGFEILIKASGGSGSLAGQSSYAGTTIFRSILFAHIIGAVITYFLWFIQIIISNLTYKKSLPGKMRKTHKVLGMIVFIGLVFTAASAIPVYLLTLDIV